MWVTFWILLLVVWLRRKKKIMPHNLSRFFQWGTVEHHLARDQLARTAVSAIHHLPKKNLSALKPYLARAATTTEFWRLLQAAMMDNIRFASTGDVLPASYRNTIPPAKIFHALPVSQAYMPTLLRRTLCTIVFDCVPYPSSRTVGKWVHSSHITVAYTVHYCCGLCSLSQQSIRGESELFF